MVAWSWADLPHNGKPVGCGSTGAPAQRSSPSGEFRFVNGWREPLAWLLLSAGLVSVTAVVYDH